MMPQGNVSPVVFKFGFSIIQFTPSHSSMSYNITIVLSCNIRILLDLTLFQQSSCGALGRILVGMTLKVHKRKVVPKPQRSQNSIHCGKDVVTLLIDILQQSADKILTVYFQSMG